MTKIKTEFMHMARSRTTLLLILCLLAPSAVFGQRPLELMKEDFDRGRITERQYIVNQGYAAFAPERMDARYRFEAPNVRCGTFIASEIMQNFDKLSAAEQAFFSQYLSRPSPSTLPSSYNTSEGNFSIHYTTVATSVDRVPSEDANQNGIPDFVEEAGFAFEHALRYHVDTLGYNPPPDDSDGVYDVYMRNLYGGMYGMTIAEYDDPSTTKYDPISYIEISNDFQDPALYTKGVDALRVTAAHELHHAIQFGYTFRQIDAWFYEWTSTWLEDMVWDNINDYYQYLPRLFQNFHKPIRTRDQFHEYGMSIWQHYITKAYSPDIIKAIWEQMFLKSALDLIVEVTEAETGRDFEDVLHDFYVWNYYTGARADTVNFFTDGAHYPEVRYTTDVYQESDTTLAVNNSYLSASYLRITRQQATTFSVSAESGTGSDFMWRAGLLASDDTTLPTGPHTSTIPFSDGVNGSAQVTTYGTNPELVIVATSAAQELNLAGDGTYDLTFDLTFRGPALINNNKLLPTRPSPANFSRFGTVVIPFVLVDPSDVELKIYSITGRLIRSFPAQHFNPGLHTSLVWDGTDDGGNSVASGVYLYIMKGDGFTDMKKMAIVR